MTNITCTSPQKSIPPSPPRENLLKRVVSAPGNAVRAGIGGIRAASIAANNFAAASANVRTATEAVDISQVLRDVATTARGAAGATQKVQSFFGVTPAGHPVLDEPQEGIEDLGDELNFDGAQEAPSIIKRALTAVWSKLSDFFSLGTDVWNYIWPIIRPLLTIANVWTAISVCVNVLVVAAMYWAGVTFGSTLMRACLKVIASVFTTLGMSNLGDMIRSCADAHFASEPTGEVLENLAAEGQVFTPEKGMVAQCVSLGAAMSMCTIAGMSNTAILQAVSKNYNLVYRLIGTTSNILYEVLAITPVAFQHTLQEYMGIGGAADLGPDWCSSDEERAILEDLLLFGTRRYEVLDSPVDSARIHDHFLAARLRLTKNARSYTKEQAAFDRQVVSFLKGDDNALRHCRVSVAHRQTPTCFYIEGPSGIGKSVLMEALGRQLGNRVYARAQGSKDGYFNAYHGQDTIVYDDYLAVYNIEYVEELIRLVSSVPFIAPQADIADKGLEIAPKRIFISTNRSFKSPMPKLTCPDAFTNRCVWVETLLVPRFADKKGRLDFKKHRQTITDSGRFPHLAFRIHTRSVNDDGKDHVTTDYDGLLEFCRECEAESQANYQASVQAAINAHGAGRRAEPLVNLARVVDRPDDELKHAEAQVLTLPVTSEARLVESRTHKGSSVLKARFQQELIDEITPKVAAPSHLGVPVSNLFGKALWRAHAKALRAGTQQAIDACVASMHDALVYSIMHVYIAARQRGDTFVGSRPIHVSRVVRGHFVSSSTVIPREIVELAISSAFRNCDVDGMSSNGHRVSVWYDTLIAPGSPGVLLFEFNHPCLDKGVVSRRENRIPRVIVATASLQPLPKQWPARKDHSLMTSEDDEIKHGGMDLEASDSTTASQNLRTTKSEDDNWPADASVLSDCTSPDEVDANPPTAPSGWLQSLRERGVIKELMALIRGWSVPVAVEHPDAKALAKGIRSSEALIWLNHQRVSNDKVVRTMKYTFCLASTAMALFLGYKYVQRFPDDPSDPSLFQASAQSRTAKGFSFVGKRRGGSGQKRGRQAKHDSGMLGKQSSHAHDQMDSACDARHVVAQNVIKISRGASSQHATVLAGNVLTTTAHFFFENGMPIKTGTVLKLDTPRGVFEVPFDPSCAHVECDNGVYSDEIIYVAKGLPSFRNIVAHFYPGYFDDVPEIDTPAYMLKRDGNLQQVDAFRIDTPLSYVVAKCTFNTQERLAYRSEGKACTQRGDCGLPILICKDGRYWMAGIHAAMMADQSFSFGTFMSRDFIEQCLNLSKVVAHPQANLVSHDNVPRDMLRLDREHPELECTGFDTIKGKGATLRQKLSDYVKTPIADHPMHAPVLEGYAPCILSDSDPRIGDKTMQQLRLRAPLKAVGCRSNFETQHFEAAQKIMLETVHKYVPQRPAQLMSIKECLNGNPDFKHMNGLDMSTSAGYSASLDLPGATKGSFFKLGEDGLYDFDRTTEHGRALWQRHCFNEEEAEFGCVPDTVWNISMKSEILPLRKILNPATRSIWVGPVEDLIMVKKYCGDFVSAQILNHGVGPSQVGMNPFSSDWDRMCKKFVEVNEKGMEGDYSGFETVANKAATDDFADYMNTWYAHFGEPTDSFAHECAIRRRICNGLIDNQFRADPFFYMNPGMLSSGHFLTTMFNCWLNEKLTRYSFHKSFVDTRQTGDVWEEYDKGLSIAIYGDDIGCTISDYVSTFWGQQSHADNMALANVVFTPGLKTAKCTNERKNFLGIGFIGHTSARCVYDWAPGREYWCVPTVLSTLKPTTFYKPGEKPLESLMLLVNDVLRRNFPGAGRERFEELRNQYLDSGEKASPPIDMVLHTWDELVEDYKQKGAYTGGYENNGWTEEEGEKLVEFASRTHYANRPKFSTNDNVVAQMETEEPEMLSNAVTEPPTVVGLPAETVSTIAPSVNIMDLCKRASVVEDFQISVLNAGMDNITLIQKNRGYLQYFSNLYRYWSGGLVLNVYSSSRTIITASNENYNTTQGNAFPSIPNSPLAAPNQGYYPISVTGQVGGFNSAVIPWKSEFDYTVLPHATKSLPYTRGMFYSTSRVFVRPVSGTVDGVSVCGSDSINMGYVFQVPRLRVTGNVFQHTVGTPAQYPAVVRIVHGAGETLMPFSTATWRRLVNVTGYTRSTLPITTSHNAFYPMVNALVPLSELTDLELRSLGYNVISGQTRIYNLPQIDLLFDCSFQIPILSSVITLIKEPAVVSARPISGLNLSPNFANVIRLENGTGLAVTVSDSFVARVDSLEEPDFLEKLGFPPAYTPVPDYSGGETLTIAPQSNVPRRLENTWYVPFTDDVDGFFEAAPLEFKEGYEVIAQMDTGVVIDEHKVETVNFHVESSNTGIGAPTMDYAAIAARPQVVSRFVWSTTDAPGTQLLQLSMPWDLLTSETAVNPYRLFRYVSFDSIELTFTVQSNPYQSGTFIVYWVPTTDPDEVNTTIASSLVSQTTLPSSIMIPGGCHDTYKLSFPWQYPAKVLDISRLEEDPLFGLVTGSVFSVLRVGAEAPVTFANITVSASVIGAKFSVPRIGVAPSLLDVATTRERIKNHRKTFAMQDVYRPPVRSQAFAQMLTKIRAPKHKPLCHHVEPQMMAALGAAGTMGLSMLAVKAVDFAGKKLGNATGGGGGSRDKPNDYSNPPPARVTFEPRVAAVEGVTYAGPLDERIGASYESTGIPTTPNETSFEDLCARPSYSGSFSVNLSATDEQIVFEEELSPTSEVTLVGADATFQPTLQCYLSLAATFWRCEEVKYRITMVGCGQSLRLAFLTNIGGFSAPEIETYSQYVQFVDFSKENPTVEITIPWQCPRNRLRVSKGYDQDRTRYAFGSLYARVIGSLQATEIMPDTVDFLVFVSYKGMELSDFSTGPVDFTPQ